MYVWTKPEIYEILDDGKQRGTFFDRKEILWERFSTFFLMKWDKGIDFGIDIYGHFLSHGATPSHHPFTEGDFPVHKNHPVIKG